jgi:GT2 family glycosyltransferase
LLRGKDFVPQFPRFDESPRIGASDLVLAQRWSTFHRSVRAQSGRAAQLLGPLIGDDTRRRRWLERYLSRRAGVSHDHEPAIFLPNRSVLFAPVAEPPSLADDAQRLSQEVLLSDRTGESLVTDVEASEEEWVLLAGPNVAAAHRALALLWPYRHGADVLFADELIGDAVHFKTAHVGPHSLLSSNVVGRPTLVRRSAVAAVGGLRATAGAAAEHDLFLRLHEQGARFHHVPSIVDLGRHVDSDPTSLTADTIDVVREALTRRGVEAEVRPGPLADVVDWHVTPPTWPAVDIIIPTRDRLELLERCLASVTERSTYPNYTITILDNDSAEPATLDYFTRTPHHVVRCPGPFNYAAIMNRGVAATTAPIIVMLNNDTVVETPDWLERMVGALTLDDVALVGCRQVDGLGRHDHDGIVLAPYPQHLRFGDNWLQRDAYVDARRDVTAVTGAVAALRRTEWDRVGGMDETLAVVMNDVDLCLRLQDERHFVLYLPDVVVRHDASSSRGRLDPLADRNIFVRRWDIFGSFVDPFFPERLRLYGRTMVALPEGAPTSTP